MKTSIVYQAYGSETIKYETVYSILSFIYYHAIPEDILLHIQTDDKAFFEKFFFKTKISYHLLTNAEVKKIKKDDGLKEQLKQELLNSIRQSTNASVLYLHSNTYFTKKSDALPTGDFIFHYRQEDNYGSRIQQWVKNREATMEGNMVCQCLDLDLPALAKGDKGLWQTIKKVFSK
jgi:hypothetical protein